MYKYKKGVMDLYNKRPIPSEDVLRKRSHIFELANDITPLSPHPMSGDLQPEGLEMGNKKTGIAGKYYDRIFVFNLPIRITCPGATQWCAIHCYNSDDRVDVYPMDKWRINLWWAVNSPACLKEKIAKQLKEEYNSRTAVRFHSCGDFYSVEYIQMWREICQSFPDIRFWGYTRSWAVHDLSPYLASLVALRNVNLFASWDRDIAPEPIGWRKSLVAMTNEEVGLLGKTGNAYVCPEQYNLVRCCADCALCIRSYRYDVIFILH
jgi:hypothetical protein